MKPIIVLKIWNLRARQRIHARRDPADERRLRRDLLVRRVLIEPVALVHHLERSERLLRLIVVVEVPWQIRDREEQRNQRGDNPEGRALLNCRAFL